MKFAESTRAKFAFLHQTGSLPLSGCGKEFLRSIEPLLAGGVLIEKRSGGGRCVAVRDAGAFSRFLTARFPRGTSAVSSDRISGVAGFRDSKAVGSERKETVFARVWKPDSLLQGGKPAGAEMHTKLHGVFAFVLDEPNPYTLHGKCALVENRAVFAHIDALDLDLDLVLYGSGRASNRLIQWLAQMDSTDFELFHFPDYDPVGLSEHERLRRKLGSKVSMYLPGGLAHLFARYSNRALLDHPNSRTLLARLNESDSEAIRQVVELIHRHNAGLEQEALFVNHNALEQ